MENVRISSIQNYTLASFGSEHPELRGGRFWIRASIGKEGGGVLTVASSDCLSQSRSARPLTCS